MQGLDLGRRFDRAGEELTYTARMITGGTSCAMSPPAKLHTFPSTQVTTNGTLRP